MTSIMDLLTNGQFENFLEAQAGLSDMTAEERVEFNNYKNDCERRGRNMGTLVGGAVGFSAGGTAGGLVGGLAGSAVPVAGTIAGAGAGAAAGSTEGAILGAIGGGAIGTVMGEVYSIFKYSTQRRWVRNSRTIDDGIGN